MEIARFLAAHPPFDALDERTLRDVAGRVQIEFFGQGTRILARSGTPVRALYVVRTGAVELLDDGHVLDLLGPGESFGHPSLLSGLEPHMEVRAVEDTLCYLIDADDAAELLATPGGLRFLSQSLRRRTVRALEGTEGVRADPWRGHVGSLVGRSPITLPASRSVAEAAELMARERVSSLLVPLGGTRPGAFGILTDRDLRTRVLAAGRPNDTPIHEVMTTDVVMVEAEDTLAEVLATMLEHGVHHMPVVDERGEIMGVVTDTDLLGLERMTPFHLRTAIERAATEEEAAEIGRRVPGAVRASIEGGVDPVDIGHMVAVTIDALTRRLLDLAIERIGDPPAPWSWLALGSEARHEQALATDQDHALAYDPLDRPIQEIEPYFARLATSVTAGLESAGIPRCRAGVTAANPNWRGTIDDWSERFRAWMDEPGAEGSTLTAIAFDYRRVDGPLPIERTLDELVGSAPRHPIFLRHLLGNATATRPPTGFFRDFVVRSGGEHAGALDVKHGGVMLITGLARACALMVGSTEIRTLRRLRVAGTAGVIDEEATAALEEAFRLLWQVRLEHHCASAHAGRVVDDFVNPQALRPITRHALKESFRAIERTQRALAIEHGLHPR